MLTNGDKLIVTKTVAPFLKEGDVVEVTNVTEDGIISFAFGKGLMHMGVMNTAECEAHFKKVEEKTEAPTITEEYILEIMENSEFDVRTVFDKCTVVACRLPNGFVITECSSCVSPENYDEDMGVEICAERIKNKIWELEAYRLQSELHKKDEEGHNCDYEECECYDCDECDECDECGCHDCEDYGCPNNPNY